MNLVEMTSAARPADVTLSIVIPVYNEQAMLGLLQAELDAVIKGLTKERVEVLYVNDGSSDDSWSLLCQLQSHVADIRCLDLSRNFGKEAAVSAGLDHAKGQAVILLDADLQDPPSYIPKMLAEFHRGFDVVNMQRSKRIGESSFKRGCAFLYYRLLNVLSDVPLQADVGDFRLLSRRVVEQIKRLPERNRYMKGIMSWPGFKQTTLCFERPERVAGETKWSFFQLLRLGVAGITAFSVKPLRLATWLGGLLSLTAFGYGTWVLSKTLIFGEAVAGYPSMMLVQLFLGGVQLMAIGLLGEYVGRIFVEAKQRPLYLIMEETVQTASEQKERQHG